jgi:hypothetical protein
LIIEEVVDVSKVYLAQIKYFARLAGSPVGPSTQDIIAADNVKVIEDLYAEVAPLV